MVETFRTLYPTALVRHRAANPAAFAWPEHRTAEIASRMLAGLAGEKGAQPASKESPVVKEVCRALGIPHTYKAIRAALASDATSDKAAS